MDNPINKNIIYKAGQIVNILLPNAQNTLLLASGNAI